MTWEKTEKGRRVVANMKDMNAAGGTKALEEALLRCLRLGALAGPQ